jgi:hypothetical protein
MPATDKLNGAYLVRYSERRQGAIFWGSYDNEGKFIGQGYADVPDASTDKHVFRIVSKGSSYNIYLDDALIVKNIPQDHAAGYIGLLTSQSSVAYDRVEVAGTEQAANQPSIVTLDAFSDVKILSGKWDTQSQVIRQLVTQPGDYILNSGIFAADYTLEAKITLPEGTDLGGGFIFHMPDRGSRKGASVVRLIDGGQGVFWGVFDENNQFKGKQSAKISPAQSYVLKLVSHAGKMDIFVNDQAVFQDVLLDRQDGWLGLIAHGGVIQFENIRVSVTNEDPLPSGGN